VGYSEKLTQCVAAAAGSEHREGIAAVLAPAYAINFYFTTLPSLRHFFIHLSPPFLPSFVEISDDSTKTGEKKNMFYDNRMLP
jgi:hypothetical protein